MFGTFPRQNIGHCIVYHEVQWPTNPMLHGIITGVRSISGCCFTIDNRTRGSTAARPSSQRTVNGLQFSLFHETVYVHVFYDLISVVTMLAPNRNRQP